MSTGQATATPSRRFRRSAPGPYLIVGAVWFLLLILFASIKTIEPIFLWVLTQGLIVDDLLELVGLEHVSRGLGRGLVLGSYLLVGLIAWAIVERPGLDPAHRWRRAVLSWFGIQAIYAVTAIVLVQTGVIAE